MKLVGAALGYDAHLATRASSEFGRGHAGLNCKLLHGVGYAEIAQCRVDLSIDHADAIQQEDVGLRSSAGDVESTTLCSSGGRARSRREPCLMQTLPGIPGHAF